MIAIQSKQANFNGIVTKIASIHIGHAILAVLFVGMVVVMGGILIECEYQSELLKQGGNALQAYQAIMSAQAIDSVSQYVVLGVQLQLPSAGGNLQAIGIAICYFAAPVVAVVPFALRLAGFKPKQVNWELVTA